MRLIDADELEQIIKENIKDYKEANDPIRCDANKLLLWTVRGMPTVDAEPIKHGRWIFADDGYCRCSECNQKAPSIEDEVTMTDRCPHCGAKMDLKDGESE